MCDPSLELLECSIQLRSSSPIALGWFYSNLREYTAISKTIVLYASAGPSVRLFAIFLCVAQSVLFLVKGKWR